MKNPSLRRSRFSTRIAAPMTIGMAARAVGISAAAAVAGVWPDQTPTVQNAQLIRLAIELGVDREPVPIPLDPGRLGQVGFAYDRFTRAHVTARASALSGKPLDPLKPPKNLLALQLLIVAVPLTCGDRTIRATDVDVFLREAPVFKWLPVKGAGLQKLLPGVSIPAGAIGVLFDRASVGDGETVRVTYAENVCAGGTKRMDLPVSASGPRILERPMIEMPAGQPPLTGPRDLGLSGVLDLDGKLRYASVLEATTPFVAAALDAARKMRFDPARINGTPTPWTAGVIVTFGPGIRTPTRDPDRPASLEHRRTLAARRRLPPDQGTMQTPAR
jgi:hypothetical protein